MSAVVSHRALAATLGALARAADRGAPCPTNADLGLAIGRSTATALNAVRGLREAGLIRVVSNRHTRAVTIVATGRSTARADCRGTPAAATGGGVAIDVAAGERAIRAATRRHVAALTAFHAARGQSAPDFRAGAA